LEPLVTTWTRDRILEVATSELGSTDARRYVSEAAPVYAPTDHPSWCGIFVRWVWRRSGLVVPAWKMSDANRWYLTRTTEPEPGDLVYWRGSLGHQSLFVARAGSEVISIDGNTTGRDKDGRLVFSVVAMKRRPASQVLAYYRAPVETARPLVPRSDGPDPLGGEPGRRSGRA
jgi:hypothetical protein